MTIRQFLLACFCCVTPCLTAQTSKMKLSEMNLSSIYQSYGTPLPGKAVTGEPLRVAGTFFYGWYRCTGKQQNKDFTSGKIIPFHMQDRYQ